VILRSDQLGFVQSVGRALRPLALLLVLASLACFAAAIALVPGHRRRTLRSIGFGLIAAGVLVLVLRAVLGDAIVGALATTAGAEPATEATWGISTSMLTGVAIATIAYGILVVAGAWLAGRTDAAAALRARLAPYLRDPLITYGVVGAVVALVLLWGPTEATRRVVPALALIVLLVAGVEVLRRQVRRDAAAEPPEQPAPPADPKDRVLTGA
jgi:hypothetical protein